MYKIVLLYGSNEWTQTKPHTDKPNIMSTRSIQFLHFHCKHTDMTLLVNFTLEKTFQPSPLSPPTRKKTTSHCKRSVLLDLHVFYAIYAIYNLFILYYSHLEINRHSLWQWCRKWISRCECAMRTADNRQPLVHSGTDATKLHLRIELKNKRRPLRKTTLCFSVPWFLAANKTNSNHAERTGAGNVVLWTSHRDYFESLCNAKKKLLFIFFSFPSFGGSVIDRLFWFVRLFECYLEKRIASPQTCCKQCNQRQWWNVIDFAVAIRGLVHIE